MNLKLNLLNSKVNNEELVVTDLYDFWRYYFHLINIDRKMTGNEIDFLSAFCIDSSMKYIIDKVGLLKPNYYSMLKKLTEKGFLVKVGDDYKLHMNIEKLRDYIEKNHPDITFNFPFRLAYGT